MRPELTNREAKLLAALQIMKLWVVMKVEPVVSGTGALYEALKRDLNIASEAIEEAKEEQMNYQSKLHGIEWDIE